METQRQENASAQSPTAGLDMARLEKELAAMWAGMSEGEDGGGLGVIRACVLNLIVYTPAGDDRSKLDALLEEVYESSPCRSVVIISDPAAEAPSLDAYVSTRCSLSSKGSKQICGEQITIEAMGEAAGRVASAVEPLLVPDVPVFLWWKDIPHYEDKLFERLVGVSDRLLIDSAAFDNPGHDLLRLAKILRGNARRLALSDLNWGRLTPWRSLVAGFWDVAHYRPLLEQIDRVEITFAVPEGGGGQLTAEAILTAGWLASRLGWSVDPAATVFEEASALVGMTAGDGRRIKVELRPGRGASSGVNGLGSLVISSGTAAEFCVELKPGGDRLETITRIGAGEHTVGRLLCFEEQSEGRRLGGELLIHARDRVYEQAVASAGAMLRALGFE